MNGDILVNPIKIHVDFDIHIENLAQTKKTIITIIKPRKSLCKILFGSLGNKWHTNNSGDLDLRFDNLSFHNSVSLNESQKGAAAKACKHQQKKLKENRFVQQSPGSTNPLPRSFKKL